MKKNNKAANSEELNFWQPASDMFSALMLIMVLVILLLGLYLVRIPEHDELDPYAGDSYAGVHADGSGNAEATMTPVPTPFFWFPDSGNGGGFSTPVPTYDDTTATPTVTPTATPTITPVIPGHGGSGGGEGGGEGTGDMLDPGIKSAVYVMVVDAETDRTVKEANVQFELYGESNTLQVLNVYYPERLSFRTFETNEAGVFYLPEKIMGGLYELHEMTEPEGYDAAKNVLFEVAESYDWPEPLVVRVPVYPSRNIIQVSMIDEETGLGVPGGTFDVIAAEDIITNDGTRRYRSGQVVTEIICDEDGLGQSEEIYLGNYLLRQRDIPPYYAGMTEDIEVAVEKKTHVLPELTMISCARTRINVTVVDELYTASKVSGASFVVTSSLSDPIEVSTDVTGRLTLDMLEKGTVYRIHQIGSTKGYRPNEQDHAVTVSPSGWIDGATSIDVTITNRMIRVNIGLTDEFSSIQIPGVNLALYNHADELIHTWTTTGSMQPFTDLEPGSYYLIKDGDLTSRYGITVLNQAEIQKININTSYVLHYVVYGSAGLLTAGLLAGVLLLVRRRRRKNHR